jgi:hypothetical protein
MTPSEQATAEQVRFVPLPVDGGWTAQLGAPW